MLQLKLKDAFYLLAYAIPNTILSFSIIYIINKVLTGHEEFLNSYMILVFLAIIVYAYLLNIIFQKRLNKFSFKRLYENEKRLFNQIVKAPLATLEKFGTQRFYTAIEDLRLFSSLPFAVTHTINSLLMLILGIVYMFTLSVVSALIVIALIMTVAICYFVVINSMSVQVAALRKFNDLYYTYVKDLLGGFKELKLSALRRKNMMKKYLEPNREKCEDADFQVNYVFLSINLISQYGLYFVIAIIMFGLPAFGVLDREDMIAYVIVLLFISGPINNLINLQQLHTRLKVANSRIKKFMSDFQINHHGSGHANEENLAFHSLHFKDIVFHYENESHEKTFAFGPVNFQANAGEVLFIVGGNGSGKSTFVNILTGLYQPTSGTILFNEQEHTGVQDHLQDSIAAIFTDNHLFSNNYENYKLENNTEYKRLLKEMELDQIVTDDKDESARRRFSKGQSKRMSMIFALLEKKPILILDEWAADQDPYFRKLFYEQLIPKLKREGKTIIAVTHDDAYFHHADRIIKFDYGKIVSDTKVSNTELVDVGSWAK